MSDFDFGLIAAAWLTGLAGGGGHCLGMCGGILASLGTHQQRGLRGVLVLLSAHCGRVFGYSIAGAIAGLAGSGIAAGLFGPHGSNILRYVAAALIAAIGLQLLLGRPLLGRLERGGAAFWLRIAPLLRPLLPPRTAARAFCAGALWGWLPCGLVYAQLAVAAASGSVLQGAVVMAVFGLGTLLSLSALSALLHTAGLARLPNRASGALLVLFAAWTALPLMLGSSQPMH
jgi:hypothetical protein